MKFHGIQYIYVWSIIKLMTTVSVAVACGARLSCSVFMVYGCYCSWHLWRALPYKRCAYSGIGTYFFNIWGLHLCMWTRVYIPSFSISANKLHMILNKLIPALSITVAICNVSNLNKLWSIFSESQKRLLKWINSI